MKDNKIDVILDKHLNEYNVELEQQKTEQLLGNNFITKLGEHFDYEDLEEKVSEAKLIMANYLNGKNLSSPKERAKLVEYRECLLLSFLHRPELDTADRTFYVDVYLKFSKIPDNNLQYDEAVFQKAILWHRQYKKQNIDIEYASELALLAINDQVCNSMYHEIINENFNEKIQKNKK